MTELGWLAPDGTMYTCSEYEHLEQADKLVKKYNYQNLNSPSDETLLKNGWVHIPLLTFFDHGYHFIWYNRLSEDQKRYLKPIFEDPNELIVEMSRRDWELENK